jgi:hypothetical protein
MIRNIVCMAVYHTFLQYRKITSIRPVYYSILNSLGKKWQYITIKFPLDKQCENAWVCY